MRHKFGEADKIAHFLGLNLTLEEIALVAERTSFETMKRESDKFDTVHLFDEFKEKGLVPKEVNGIMKSLVDKGPLRKGSVELPENFVAKINAHVEMTVGKDIARWIDQGGDLPDVDLPKTS